MCSLGGKPGVGMEEQDPESRRANLISGLPHPVEPKYLGGAMDGITKKISAAYHQLITNEFRRLAPYGQKVQRSAEEVKRIIQQVYSKYPLP